jgi:hypothetical protein
LLEFLVIGEPMNKMTLLIVAGLAGVLMADQEAILNEASYVYCFLKYYIG